MRGFSGNVLSCLERERLEQELSEACARGRNLSRLRNLTSFERAAFEGASSGSGATQGARRGAWLPAVDVLCRFGAGSIWS
jgi:hypothetical protein